MNIKACVVASAFVLLAGCGSPEPEKKPVETKPKEEAPPKPEAPKGLGLSQAKLLTGINGISFVQLETSSGGMGNVYKGGTGDGQEGRPGSPTEAVNMIVYGTPEVVTFVLFTAGLPYADFPDSSKYPDYLQRNIKIQDTVLANLFGGSVPADVKAGLDWAKDNAKKEKVVSADGKTVKIKYEDKAISINVK